MRNPLGPLPPMEPGVHLSDDEWQYWTSYFAKLFPTADETWINKMVVRIVKTLEFSGCAATMSSAEHIERLKIFRDSLRNLPPDPNNVLMKGK